MDHLPKSGQLEVPDTITISALAKFGDAPEWQQQRSERAPSGRRALPLQAGRQAGAPAVNSGVWRSGTNASLVLDILCRACEGPAGRTAGPSLSWQSAAWLC